MRLPVRPDSGRGIVPIAIADDMKPLMVLLKYLPIKSAKKLIWLYWSLFSALPIEKTLSQNAGKSDAKVAFSESREDGQWA
jgi:hypothetical protein